LDLPKNVLDRNIYAFNFEFMVANNCLSSEDFVSRGYLHDVGRYAGSGTANGKWDLLSKHFSNTERGKRSE
jgi:hypothetical protein